MSKLIYQFTKSKTVDEKTTDYKFVFRKPNRQEREDISIEYSRKLFYFQSKKGVPSAAQVSKLYEDESGGILSDKEEQEFLELKLKGAKVREQLVELPSKKFGKKKAEQESERLIKEMEAIRERLVDLETIRSSVFNHTAEIYARNSVIEYMLLNFSQWASADEEGEYPELEDMFKGNTTEERYDSFDAFDVEGDSFIADAIRTLTLVATWTYQGAAKSQEELDELLNGG